MKIKVMSSDGKNIIKESEINIDSKDILVATIHDINGIPASLEKINFYHNMVSDALESKAELITIPECVELNILKM